MTAAPQQATPAIRDKTSLSDVFNDFVEDAERRFPNIRGHLLVMDMNQNALYGPTQLDQDQTGLTPEEAVKHVNKLIIEKTVKGRKIKSCAEYASDKSFHTIFFAQPVDQEKLDNLPEPETKELLSTLDHELAHLSIPDALPKYTVHSTILAECIADAYAAIRHYQRFGADSEDDLFWTPARRAISLIRGDKRHFTSFVTQEIIARKHHIDFKNITPEQAAGLARRFAMEYAPPEALVHQLYETFSDVRRAMQTGMTPEDWIPALAETTLKDDNDYHAFKLGNTLLAPYLETRRTLSGRPLELPKEYLDEIQERMEKQKLKFRQEGILLRMPMRKNPRLMPAGQGARQSVSPRL